ncbi:MAG: hypothetical protein H8E44_17800 [Planctomycetes bacterium]|nr:hypothetical protein [Planctomycetota bacterium]MBL7037603.1 hypothetical protein [Pirellulaceae bacterium]
MPLPVAHRPQIVDVVQTEFFSFNPKPEAMVGSGMDRPDAARAIASGFGLNELSPEVASGWKCVQRI